MNDNAQPVAIHFEDTEFGPSLTIEPTPAVQGQTGILRTDRLATLEVTGGSARGSTFIWDPSEVVLSPIR